MCANMHKPYHMKYRLEAQQSCIRNNPSSINLREKTSRKGTTGQMEKDFFDDIIATHWLNGQVLHPPQSWR
ncbi:hypothetical protein AXF42_Ash002942 [Apostasia shenzhenica]|uniref:Uncharacterized protein n=1 Tax=Apostasia shenzhenica TaxID=1088818 RepID=A0A2I0A7T8_9ASPA|nr:hypothetical protein AXF42_Ash002942 [Apostasia shenzhenica]